ERLLAVLGAELASELIDVSADEYDGPGGITLWGLAGLPSISRATNKAQHVYINGRPVNDRTIQHAIKEAYRGLIEPGRHPTVALLLEMDPRGVDVNVHPAKAEVRFRDSGLIHSVTLRALREALKRADLTPAVGSLRPQTYGGGRPFDGPTAIGPSGGAPGGAGGFGDFFTRPDRPAGRLDSETRSQALRRRASAATAPPAAAEEANSSAAVSHQAPSGDQGAEATPVSQPFPFRRPSSLQVHNSYVVTQDDQGVV